MKEEKKSFIILAIAFVILVIWLIIVSALNIALVPILNLAIAIFLAMLTAFNVHLTSQAVQASNKQAEASTKMASEMKEERLASSKPMMVQKPIYKIRDEIIETNYFSHFMVCNIGNGTSIEPVIILRNENKDLIEAHRSTFFKPAEETQFKPDYLFQTGNYYLDCVYENISHVTGVKSLNLTRLPFIIKKASKEGELNLIPGELSFEFGVSEKELIAVLPGDGKPK